MAEQQQQQDATVLSRRYHDKVDFGKDTKAFLSGAHEMTELIHRIKKDSEKNSKVELKNLKPTPLNHSTTTSMLTTNFHLTGIMGDVMHLFATGHPAGDAYIKEHLPETFCRATSKTKRGAVQPPRVMLNCLIFRYVNTTRRAIKIFSNGGIHVTGALDPDAAVEDATLVCRLFDVVLGVPPGTCAVTGYQLQVRFLGRRRSDSALRAHRRCA